MKPQQPANDSPYWPVCLHDPGFLPWLSRILAIVNNTRPGTPFPVLLRMARKQGDVPHEWGLAVQFLMGHATTGRSAAAG